MNPNNFLLTGYVRESSIVKPNGVLPVNRSTLWRWVRDGHFPKPYRLGPNTVAWKAEEVRKFMDSAEPAGAAEPTRKAA
jgi:predicted site-specific integrase-resolvase